MNDDEPTLCEMKGAVRHAIAEADDETPEGAEERARMMIAASEVARVMAGWLLVVAVGAAITLVW